MSYADQCYEEIMGFPPTTPAAQRTAEERRASLDKFFAIMDSMTNEELAENPLAGRPLNVSILQDDRSSDVNAA